MSALRAFRLGIGSLRESDRRGTHTSVNVGALLRGVADTGSLVAPLHTSAAPEPRASSATVLSTAPGRETPSVASGTAQCSSPATVRQRQRASLRVLPLATPENAPNGSAAAANAGESVAHPLLSTRSSAPFAAAIAHDDDLPSLESLDTLPAAALPGVVAELAARQAHLAALQARAAARLAVVDTRPSISERIPPGQRLSAEQLAARLGRSVDYVYRHANDWPFTVREGRSVTFDEAGFVRWQTKRTAANAARRREVP